MERFFSPAPRFANVDLEEDVSLVEPNDSILVEEDEDVSLVEPNDSILVEEDVSLGDAPHKDAHMPDAPREDDRMLHAEGPSSSRMKRTRLNEEESFDLSSLEADPGLRRPISDYPPNERDVIGRAHLNKGPCRPVLDGGFPLRMFNDNQRRKFGEEWYVEFGKWIEYSTSKDAAFCPYCYLFKKGGGADNFVVKGFRNWKKKEKIQKHEGKIGSGHHKAYMSGQNLLNQNQSIVAAFVKQTDQQREDYKDKLEASIKMVRLLLELGLPFRGHDESIDSMKKGKFQTCLRFLSSLCNF